MKFWDASALVPLIIKQSFSKSLQTIHQEDSSMAVWWGSVAECTSAISRLIRENKLDSLSAQRAYRRTEQLRKSWIEIEPSEEILLLAVRLLKTHPLKAADSFQLASAISVANVQSILSSIEFVCCDEKLGLAAEKEGLVRCEVESKIQT